MSDSVDKEAQKFLEDHGYPLVDDQTPPADIIVIYAKEGTPLHPEPFMGIGIQDPDGENAVASFHSWETLIALIDTLWSAGERTFGAYIEEG